MTSTDLDAKIARHVFGLTLAPGFDHETHDLAVASGETCSHQEPVGWGEYSVCFGDLRSCRRCGLDLCERQHEDGIRGTDTRCTRRPETPLPYSTDARYALAVVEKMHALGYWFECRMTGHLTLCAFAQRDGTPGIQAVGFERAVCHAALVALGVEAVS